MATPTASPSPRADVTVIMVSYNTRELTLRAIETLLGCAGDVAMRVIVWDNCSQDGSADAIARRFPEVELLRSEENVGFAQANNLVAERADTEWLLLLNPDTETQDRAVERLLAFARQHPQAGITGGRTVYPDGSLNPSSCLNKMTLWSLFCSATGLTYAFNNTTLFNPEGIGGWRRDSVRQVDIVVGCLLLVRRDLWHELGGFRTRYFMYGEDADLCLRAGALGYRPMITPEAQIMHLAGASSPKRQDKLVRLMRAKATLIRDHWPPLLNGPGLALLWLWIASRRSASRLLARPSAETWRAVWDQRKEWLAGY